MLSTDIYTTEQNKSCSCVICKKQFSVRGIHSHYLTAHTKIGGEKIKLASAKGASKGGQSYKNKMELLKLSKIEEYNKSPNLCKHCNSIIPYNKMHNKFCSQSCAATHTNLNRSYDKAKETWANKSKAKREIKSKAPYSTVFNCTCQHCKIKFINRTQKKYCGDCEHLYSHDGRAKFWFTFNVFHYPELFDLSLITTYGFRDNKTNPNGITRDHKVSVNDAIRNNYDPYYIKHPMNCELMFFNENNKKKTNSSITYEELIQLVDEYDLK